MPYLAQILVSAMPDSQINMQKSIAEHRVKPEPTQRVLELDGIRGIAILLVVFFHYFTQHAQTIPGSLPAYVVKYLSITWIGVDIFFVLSGYLVGGILLDKRGTTNYFKVFYLRRSVRIFPPYILLLLFFVVAEKMWASSFPAGMGWLLDKPLPFWTYGLYLQNFWMAFQGDFGANFIAATWSLAVEEQFYLLFPLFVYWCPKRHMVKMLVLLAVTAPLLRVVLFFVWQNGGLAGYVLLFTRWDSLLLGALGAWVVRKPKVLEWFSSHWQRLEKLLFGLCLLVVSFPFLGFYQFTFGMAVIGHFSIAVAASLLLVLVAIGRVSYVAAVLRLGVLRYIGRMSYSIYLYHTAILGGTFSLLLKIEPRLGSIKELGVTLLALTLTILLAQLTWVLFENRFIKFGHRFSYRMPDTRNEILDDLEKPDSKIPALVPGPAMNSVPMTRRESRKSLG